MASCDDCLVLDDELNVLPISRGKDIEPIDEAEEKGKGKQIEVELTELKESLVDTKPIGDLIKLAKTIDQVRIGRLLLTVRSPAQLFDRPRRF